MLEVLHELSSRSLRTLASSLKEGALSLGLSQPAISQIVGPLAADVRACLQSLLAMGCSTNHLAVLVQAIADERERAPDPAILLDLVLSGPDVPGIPTADTAATVQALMDEAIREVLLVGYVVHQGQQLFERLAARKRENPSLRVWFCLDVPRRLGDTSAVSEIVWRFGKEFRERHWPWPDLPDLFYDPRSLSDNPEQRSSLHAKCVVVDRRVALVTSANFTEAAQRRNIEVGALVRHAPFAERIADYFGGLVASRLLLQCPLV
jgi:hypothetical protein